MCAAGANWALALRARRLRRRRRPPRLIRGAGRVQPRAAYIPRMSALVRGEDKGALTAAIFINVHLLPGGSVSATPENPAVLRLKARGI